MSLSSSFQVCCRCVFFRSSWPRQPNRAAKSKRISLIAFAHNLSLTPWIPKPYTLHPPTEALHLKTFNGLSRAIPSFYLYNSATTGLKDTSSARYPKACLC